MSYLDAVIGPGPWLHEEYLMEGSTFYLIMGLIALCFVVIAVSVIVLFAVMRSRRGNDQTKNEADSDAENDETEES